MDTSRNKYKVCVFGSNGMAGHLVAQYLTEQDYNVIGVARTKSKYLETFTCDIFEKEKVSDFIATENFNFIINAVGILNTRCDNYKDEAIFINSYFPHFLAHLTKNKKTKIIHLSTDCVFSGQKGQYKEDDHKDGETFYDTTKSLGEVSDNKNLTFRNSLIGPDANPNGIGLFNWFMR